MPTPSKRARPCVLERTTGFEPRADKVRQEALLAAPRGAAATSTHPHLHKEDNPLFPQVLEQGTAHRPIASQASRRPTSPARAK